MNTLRNFRLFRVVLISLLSISILNIWPPAIATAAIERDKRLDDSVNEFARGTFQRTSLANYQNLALDSRDTKGALQLLPISVIKSWQRSGYNIPEKVSQHGVAAIGNTIFVIGGMVNTTGTTLVPSSKVWSNKINEVNGTPINENWLAEPDLPAVRHSDSTNSPLYRETFAPVYDMAVSYIDLGNNNGYIYVIGGGFIAGATLPPISSYAVNIAKVVNGRIQSWTTSDTNTNFRLPGDPRYGGTIQDGLQAAESFTMKVGNDYYVYVVGGVMRYRDGAGVAVVGSPEVYYAKVNSSTGMLVPPSSGANAWVRNTDKIPMPDIVEADYAGLWDATVIADTITTTTTKQMVYVMGGQYQSSEGNPSGVDNIYSADIYSAEIQSNGSLKWSTWQGTLPTPRIKMAGLTANGKLYLTGGHKIVGGNPLLPEAAVMVSMVEDNFELMQLGDNGSNFLYEEVALQAPVAPRADHGMVKVAANNPNEGYRAFVYVIGGRGASPDVASESGSDTVIYAPVGSANEVQTLGFPRDSWYYSSVFETNVTFSGEQVKSLTWYANLPVSSNDIELSYRLSDDLNCNNPVSLLEKPWVDVDGDTTSARSSKQGRNEQSLGVPPPTAHCFQYRARIVGAASGEVEQTPSLLSVNIVVLIPGSPDLRVSRLEANKDANNKLVGLYTSIINQYQGDTSVNPTQPVDDGRGGSFFVDLFVFGPGGTASPPSVPWTVNPSGHKACAVVMKSEMTPNQVVNITKWYASSDNTCKTTPVNTMSFFQTPGEYTVYVVVDGFDCNPADSIVGCVDENSPNAENNNVSTALKITIPADNIPDPDIPDDNNPDPGTDPEPSDPIIYLPLVQMIQNK
jgi:hypothetical protein